MHTNDLSQRARVALGILGASVLAVAAPVAVSAASARDLANQVLHSPRITLATVHVSGVVDRANAHQNIVDTANGQAATRSHYQNAPGGTVGLSPAMLQGMLHRSARFPFRVSEIAGGSHAVNSRHYRGVAFDADIINGHRVTSQGSDETAFMAGCRADGATEVLFEGTHVHCAW
ncbi:MAG: zinc D-Ala-D-Ala carboxypeptidase [Chloroflexota bacterium]|nr:zinc D-Ala-D-Ala carboxypeptidase [Chloroflexota bacterium]